MRPIQLRDFLKVAISLLGCWAFFALIVIWEWRRAEPVSKGIAIGLLAAIAALVARALVIYRPRDIDLRTIRVVRGPGWSSTIVGIRFVWIDVEHNGVRKRIRVVEDDSAGVLNGEE